MILIVEDDPQNLNLYRGTVELVQEKRGDMTPIATATTFEEAMKFFLPESAARGEIPELVIVDMEIPIEGHKDPRAGFRLIDQLRDRYPATKWIPITAHVQLSQIELEDGRRLQDALFGVSAWGIFFKDQLAKLEEMLQRFFSSRAEKKESQQAGKGSQELEGLPLHYREEVNGQIFVTREWELKEEIRIVASNGRDIWLFGERGTGKRLVARMIHQLSGRRDNGFEMVEGGLETDELEDLLFSEIIDNVRGGTLYIRHLNRLSMEIQRRLSHYRRYKSYDVRIIGGICESRHTFRDYDCILGDFFDSKIPLDLPPLRERKGDIPILVEVFLEQFSREHEQEGGRSKQFVDRPNIYRLLQAQDWRRGNIAELRMLVEEVLLKTTAPVVTVEDFEKALRPFASTERDEERAVDRDQSPERRRRRIVVTEEDIRRFG